MLAGLSQCWTFSTPPDFSATAGAAAISAPKAMNRHRTRCIFEAPPLLLVEPHVFHAQPVVDSIHRHRVALNRPLLKSFSNQAGSARTAMARIANPSGAAAAR